MSDEDVRAKFAAFMKTRLTGERARAEWRAELENGVRFVLDSKIAIFLDEKSLGIAIESATRRESFKKIVTPIFIAARTDIFPIVKKTDEQLTAFVPKEARDAIDELLGKPGLLHETLVQEIIDQDVVEEIMRDVLSDALFEFNDKVNPFFADWGLPGLIKKFVPIGGGAIIKSLDAVRGEFDKRLKPEIQKFLLGFSRRALDKTAKIVIERADDPKSIELRRSIAKWIFEQKLSELIANVDEEKFALGEKAGLLIAEEVAQSKRVQDARRSLLSAFFELHSDHTVRETLAHYGIDEIETLLDFDALADATWPSVKAIATSDVATKFTSNLVAEFLASENR